MINKFDSFIGKIIKILFLLLIILGLVISLYLTYIHFSGSTIVCNTGLSFSYLENNDYGNSCNSVLQSNYSKMFGIPTAIFGIIFYMATLIIYLLFIFRKEFIFNKILLGFTLMGLLFSVYFSYLQLFVIHSFCVYCFTSAIITLILFNLSIYLIRNKY